MDGTVGGMTVMSAFKSYFSYEFMLHCGIPAVTLEGTNKDWRKLNHTYNKIKVILPEPNHVINISIK